jgi:hypothetical protein
LKQFTDLAIAVTAVLLGEPDQGQSQPIVIVLRRPVLQRPARKPDNLACAALRRPELLKRVDDSITELEALLEDQLVQLQIGNDLCQALVLERLHLRELRPGHATELRAPRVVGRIADPGGPAGRRNIATGCQLHLELAQQLQNILVGMPLTSHRSLLSWVDT